ncbi:uncharacterized protein [Prorops nasuta]|uniref:uncharacterized protein n=1 Tax=Prorops nasuta TaxID=863751 RepID=UPI0034CFB691
MSFEKVTLSNQILEKLKLIQKDLKDENVESSPLWATLWPKNNEEKPELEHEESSQASEDSQANNFSTYVPSTQFYFTQVERTNNLENKVSQINDVAESIYEGLEKSKGNLNFAYLENLTNKEIEKTFNDLGQRLSIKGVYNLCCSLKQMNVEQQIKFISFICSNILLPKIIALEEPSRTLSSAVIECVELFPEDLQKLILIPIANKDLIDYTIITSIIKHFSAERKFIFIIEFIETISELRKWHLSVLQITLFVKIDSSSKDKLINLLLDKALLFSKDKEFGKFLLSFVKTNSPFSDDQLESLKETVSLNESIFKRTLETILINI